MHFLMILVSRDALLLSLRGIVVVSKSLVGILSRSLWNLYTLSYLICDGEVRVRSSLVSGTYSWVEKRSSSNDPIDSFQEPMSES